MPRGYTISEIARLKRQPVYRVKYAIQACRIEPVQRAGRVRLYSEAQLSVIDAALKQTRGNGRKAIETAEAVS